MSNLWRWLTGQRDPCSVTYTRFGGPGEIVDDRPQPSTIYVAPFDENDPKFIFFKLCHVQKAAVAVAGFGMSAVILIFISFFFEFDWYSHRTGIDIMALAFLFLYLGTGILIHYHVITGIKKEASHYLLPFIVAYVVTIGTEVLFTFIHMLHLQSPALDYGFKEEANGIYLFAIVVLLILIIIQGIMLTAICQCRYYLSCKEIHSMALKIAESSRTKYPGIQVIFASPEVSADTVIGSGVTTNASASVGQHHGITTVTQNGNAHPGTAIDGRNGII